MDDEEWYEPDDLGRREMDVIEPDAEQSHFTGILDASGTPIYRTPIKKPRAGFLSRDNFSRDTDDEYYEPIDVSEHG